MNRSPWRLLRQLPQGNRAGVASYSSYSRPLSRSQIIELWTRSSQVTYVCNACRIRTATTATQAPQKFIWSRGFAAAAVDSAEPVTPRAQPAELEVPEYLSDGERLVFEKLKAALSPAKLEVRDVSGGCGSMYAIDIECAEFRGLTVIKQHRKVQEVLAEEIKGWHGVQLRTKAP